ncbi:MAG: dienelactone hydrolase family protein [Alphaproteobacteria bacterium]|nr:dienelactone hydrolase family protein [Alphaproteobacteria bacterium]
MHGEWVEVKAEGVVFQAYLARPEKGGGPGLVLAHEIYGATATMRAFADLYAEEGYTVIVPDLFWRTRPRIELSYAAQDRDEGLKLGRALDTNQAINDLAAAREFLRAHPACKGKVGGLGFCLGGKLVALAAARGALDCAVSYYGVGLEAFIGELKAAHTPLVLHFGSEDKNVPATTVEALRTALAGEETVELYVYPGADHGFASSDRATYNKPAAGLAHSRSIALLRKVMGPHYNLSDLWEQHIHLEFVARDVEATMKTMVAEPYVNHIPTMTGGTGYKNLHRFYKHHFVHKSPRDTKIIPISRTVGADRVVDEGLFCFTHDIEIDWMLPGIKPTGKYVEVPIIAIVNFRGDKLTNEHIYWDQASVLVQIGLLDPQLLPVVGRDASRKLLDPNLPSNTLMTAWASSERLD